MINTCPSDHRGIVGRAKVLVATQPYFRGTSYPLSFESFENVLVVSGRVPSFHLKQILQNELGRIEGVRRIVNQVVVEYAGLGS